METTEQVTNSNTDIMKNVKNSNCEKIQKPKLQQHSKTNALTTRNNLFLPKLKKQNYDNGKCDKTQIVFKLKL